MATSHILFYRWKEGNKGVNIFQRDIFYLTRLLSACCKIYCFAFQKRRFCTVKAALLHRKTYAFAMSKRSYHFLIELSLQNGSRISVFPFDSKEEMNLLSIRIIGLIYRVDCAANFYILESISTNGVSFLNFICIFVCLLYKFFTLTCNTKANEFYGMAKL